MPDWETVDLSDICDVVLGRTPSRSSAALWDRDRTTGNVWVSIADISGVSDKWILDSKEYVSASGAEQCKRVTKGTLLASFKLSLGKLAIAGCDLFTNEAIAALPILDPSRIDRDYLYYYLMAFDWEKYAAQDDKLMGLTLNKAKVRQIPVSFPKDVQEQRRIVALLDEAFAAIDQAIENTKRNIENAKELFDSYLNEVFTKKGEGWVENRLIDLADFIDYRGRTPNKVPAGIRLITAKNIKMGYLQDDPAEYIATDEYDTWMSRGIPEYGDVLFTTEAPLANVAQLNTTDRVAFAQRVIILQPKSQQLSGDFLKYALLSQPVQADIYRNATGATVTGIKSKLLKEIVVPYPDRAAEQADMVTRLDSMWTESRRLGSLLEQKHTDLRHLKESILKTILA